MIYADQLMGQANLTIDKLQGALAVEMQTLRILSAGFIVTSLLWASWLAALIDRRLFLAAGYSSCTAVCALFGVIHSPLPGSPLLVPWNLPDSLPAAAAGQTPIYLAAGYASVALLLVAWGAWDKSARKNRPESESPNG